MTKTSYANAPRKATCFYVPDKFNPFEILPSTMHRYADCANYVAHLIASGTFYWRADDRGFVPLKATYLRNMIPRDAELPLRIALIEAGAIECDGHYKIGEKAMGYRMGERFPLNPATMRRVTCLDRRLAQRVQNHRDADPSQSVDVPVHRHLRDWLHRVKIDRREAVRIIKTTPGMAEESIIHLGAVKFIADQHWEFSHCNMGRVHTNITRLKRELRPTLSIDGQCLVSIDVANSQPLILGNIMISDRPKQEGRREREGDTGNDPCNTMEISGTFCHRYIRLCESGQLYDHMGHCLRPVVGYDIKREVMKHYFMLSYYDKNREAADSIFGMFCHTFDREFPEVAEFVWDWKRRHGYANLACTMQRAESDIIIHGACRRLMQEHPAVPLLTIHDSLLVPAAHVETAKGAMVAAFAAEGIRPTLKVSAA